MSRIHIIRAIFDGKTSGQKGEAVSRSPSDKSTYDALIADNQATLSKLEEKRWTRDSKVTGLTLWEMTSYSEFSAKLPHQQSMWLTFCGYGEINLNSKTTLDFIIGIFSKGTTTEAAIALAKTEPASDADLNNLGDVALGEVIEARRGML